MLKSVPGYSVDYEGAIGKSVRNSELEKEVARLRRSYAAAWAVSMLFQYPWLRSFEVVLWSKWRSRTTVHVDIRGVQAGRVVCEPGVAVPQELYFPGTSVPDYLKIRQLIEAELFEAVPSLYVACDLLERPGKVRLPIRRASVADLIQRARDECGGVDANEAFGCLWPNGLSRETSED